MSVKIGVGFGGWPFPEKDPDLLWQYVDACEELGIDSLWLSDRVVSEVMNVDPMIALSFIAARTTKLKFGTSVLALPLRNPTVLAKEIATLDFLSKGRSLPAVGLGTEDVREYEACGSRRSATPTVIPRCARRDREALESRALPLSWVKGVALVVGQGPRPCWYNRPRPAARQPGPSRSST